MPIFNAYPLPHPSYRMDVKSGVTIRNYHPDFEYLAEDVCLRMQRILEAERPPLLFANPIVAVTTEQPTKEFWRIVENLRAKWFKSACSTFGRRAMNGPKSWTLQSIRGDELTRRRFREFRFVEYSLCVSGLLVANKRDLPSENRSRLENGRAGQRLHG